MMDGADNVMFAAVRHPIPMLLLPQQDECVSRRAVFQMEI